MMMVTMSLMMPPVRAEMSCSIVAIAPWVIAMVTNPRVVACRTAIKFPGSQHGVNDRVGHAGGFKTFDGVDVQIVNRPTGSEISKDHIIGNSLFGKKHDLLRGQCPSMRQLVFNKRTGGGGGGRGGILAKLRRSASHGEDRKEPNGDPWQFVHIGGSVSRAFYSS